MVNYLLFIKNLYIWFKEPISYYDKINSYIKDKLVKFKKKYIHEDCYKYTYKYKDNNKLIKITYCLIYNKLIRFNKKEITTESNSKIIKLKKRYMDHYNNDTCSCIISFIQIIKTNDYNICKNNYQVYKTFNGLKYKDKIIDNIIFKTRIEAKNRIYRLIYFKYKKTKVFIIGFNYLTIFNKIYIIRSTKNIYIEKYNYTCAIIPNYKQVLLFFDL
jgi:hypothetical protein